jgi:hypothetical protein
MSPVELAEVLPQICRKNQTVSEFTMEEVKSSV